MEVFPRNTGSQAYRNDIDGLRAVAIVPVVLYHFGVPGFSGGFIGVDIFFVISGYLISGMIWTEICAGRFSVIGFYERRGRRIFPALITVLIVSFMLGFILFAPDTVKELGYEISQSASFTINLLFSHKADYFATTSATKFLLHSWSLAVEEQFYLFVPLLLMILNRQRSNIRLLRAELLGILALSLGISAYWAMSQPSSGFYLLPSRGWELLCGSLLAMGKFGSLSSGYGEAIATLGTVALVVSFLIFTSATPWPGIAAVLPCVGTAAIIWAGEGNTLPIVSRLLGIPLAVGIGKISYPLYLWHWPVLVAFRVEIFREPTVAEAGALILLSVVLAVATMILIEAPVRSRRVLSTRRQLLPLSVVMLLVCYIAGRFTYTHQGLPWRFSAESLANSGWADPQTSWKVRWYDGYQRYCEGGHFDAIFSGSACRFGAKADGKSPDFALWGDSHAEAILPALNLMAQRYGVTGQIFFHHSCMPLLAIGEAGDDCDNFNRAAAESIQTQRISHVFLVAQWSSADQLTIPVIGPSKSNEPMRRALETDREAQTMLSDTLKTLRNAGSKVYIVQDNPIQPYDVADVVIVATSQHRSIDGLGVEKDVATYKASKVDMDFRRAEDLGQISYVETRDLLCPASFCPIAKNGLAIYYDTNHLSSFGASILAPALDPIFRRLVHPLPRAGP